MKKLASRLAKHAEVWQIELSKWTREMLYNFITKFVEEVRDQNDDKSIEAREGRDRSSI